YRRQTVCVPYFFFQAEDGIRDFHVTGVQTCALPIYLSASAKASCALSDHPRRPGDGKPVRQGARRLRARAEVETAWVQAGSGARSEERRVGKESRDAEGGEA